MEYQAISGASRVSSRFWRVPFLYWFDHKEHAILMEDCPGKSLFDLLKKENEEEKEEDIVWIADAIIELILNVRRADIDEGLFLDTPITQFIDQALGDPFLVESKDLGLPNAEQWQQRARKLLDRKEFFIFGDLWPNSLLIDSGNQKIVVIDWEAARMGHPGTDLTQLAANLFIMCHSPLFNKEKTQKLMHLVVNGYSDRDLSFDYEAAFVSKVVSLVKYNHWKLADKARVVTECLEFLALPVEQSNSTSRQKHSGITSPEILHVLSNRLRHHDAAYLSTVSQAFNKTFGTYRTLGTAKQPISFVSDCRNAPRNTIGLFVTWSVFKDCEVSATKFPLLKLLSIDMERSGLDTFEEYHGLDEAYWLGLIQSFPRLTDFSVHSEIPIDTRTRGMSEYSLIKYSITQKWDRLFHVLMKIGLPTMFSHRGGTLLFLAAATNNTVALDALLSHPDTDVDEVDELHMTAIMGAASFGSPETIQKLIAKGAELDFTDNKGFSALTFAAHSGREEILNLLLDHGVSVNCDRGEAFRLVCSYNWVDSFNRMVDLGVDVTSYGPAALVSIAHVHVSPIVSRLLELGVSPNCMDKDLSTPLIAAAKRGSEGDIRFWVMKGTYIFAQDRYGRIASYYAIRRRLTAVDALLGHSDTSIGVTTISSKRSNIGATFLP